VRHPVEQPAQEASPLLGHLDDVDVGRELRAVNVDHVLPGEHPHETEEHSGLPASRLALEKNHAAGLGMIRELFEGALIAGEGVGEIGRVRGERVLAQAVLLIPLTHAFTFPAQGSAAHLRFAHPPPI